MDYYLSKVTGNRYSKNEYLNHGKGGVYRGFKDLPKDEYPYMIEREDDLISSYIEDVIREFIKLKSIKSEPTLTDVEYDKRLSKATINWIKGPMISHMKRLGLSETDIHKIVDPAELKKLVVMVEFTDLIDFTTGKKVLDEMIGSGDDCWSVMERMNLINDRDENEMDVVIKSVLADYPDKVIAYKDGNKNLFALFMGECMKRLKNANGKELSDRIRTMI